MNEAEYEALEGFESESESEFAERSRIPRPSQKPSFQRRPSPTPSYVTQVQLEAALARVDGKVKTVADGVSTINSRLSALAAAAKKEAEERKKEALAQKNDLGGKLQMLALLPLLIKPAINLQTSNLTALGASIKDASGTVTQPTATATTTPLATTTDTLTTLLPLLLVGGIGGSGGLGGGSGSGSDGGAMDMGTMLVLALALANKPLGS